MNMEQKLWSLLKYENTAEALLFAHKSLSTELNQPEAVACHMVLVILHLEMGLELVARTSLRLFFTMPHETAVRAEAAFLALVVEERFNGVLHAAKQRNLMRTLFGGLDKTRLAYEALARIMFDSEVACGALDKALEIAHTPNVSILSYKLVNAYFAACRVEELWILIARNSQLNDDNVRANAMMTGGLVCLKLHIPVQARLMLEPVVRDEFHAHHLNRRVYQALQKCYQMLASERYVDGSPEDRFRACAECKTIIDRQPLLAKDEDFLVCGGCRNVPFCSEKCHDAHWPSHRSECGKSQLPEKRIDIFAPDMCDECLYSGAKLQCTRCKKARYCDAKCQKAHWKIHKTKCVP